MRKWIFRAPVLPAFLLFARAVFAQTDPQVDLARITALVNQGALPKSTLDEAKSRLEDARDQTTLTDTLYNPTHSQNMTPAEADEMLAAAQRRVDRAQAKLEARQNLLEMGIISQAELNAVRNELTSRQLVLELAQSRVKLLQQLRLIVADEERMQMPTMENSMIRYEGKAGFKLTDMPGIEKDFKARFHHDLPVSALGQTMLHQSMGLDHRNKVDIALNPAQPEGLWLRAYLEKQHFSYMAFTSAVSGAATAPHIHIGTGSTRLLVTTAPIPAGLQTGKRTQR